MTAPVQEDAMAPRSSDEDEEVVRMRESTAILDSEPTSFDEWANPGEGKIFCFEGELGRAGNDPASLVDHIQGTVVTRRDDHVLLMVRMHADAEQIDAPLLRLVSVTGAMNILEAKRRQLVAEARRRGRSWADIARAIGTTRQSAWEKYSDPDD